MICNCCYKWIMCSSLSIAPQPKETAQQLLLISQDPAVIAESPNSSNPRRDRDLHNVVCDHVNVYLRIYWRRGLGGFPRRPSPFVHEWVTLTENAHPVVLQRDLVVFN